MGLDVIRFHGSVDEELICPICSGVLDKPLAAPKCEHAFCEECITKWLDRQPTCPVDRQPIQPGQMQQVPRILRNLLARLEVSCENAHHGCEAVVKLDLLPGHLKNCLHNPKRPVDCERGCGLTVPKDEMEVHNCVRELAAMVRAQDQRLNEQQAEIADCKYKLAEQRRELALLKDARPGNTRTWGRTTNVSNVSSTSSTVAAGQSSSPGRNNAARAANSGTGDTAAGVVGAVGAPRTVTDQIQDDQVVRWANSLTRARVTRWGGMISTPDMVLQSMIQRALLESGCPEHIVTELMSNAHERRWPPGLLTLETRQMNRRQYEQYVCRRIQNKQAVVVMACDNMHMSDDMILEPGLVMIFAHGIE